MTSDEAQKLTAELASILPPQFQIQFIKDAENPGFDKVEIGVKESRACYYTYVDGWYESCGFSGFTMPEVLDSLISDAFERGYQSGQY